MRDGGSCFMNTSIAAPFSVGKYTVSPLCRQTDAGDYIAITSLRSGSGSTTHDRVFRFLPRFQTGRNALRFAAREGRALASARAQAAA